MGLGSLLSGIVKRHAAPNEQEIMVAIEQKSESRMLERIAAIKEEMEKLNSTDFDGNIKKLQASILTNEQKITELLIAKSKEKEGWIKSARNSPTEKKPKVHNIAYSSKAVISGQFTETQINKLRWYNKQIKDLLGMVEGAKRGIKTLTYERDHKEKIIQKLESRLKRELERLAKRSN